MYEVLDMIPSTVHVCAHPHAWAHTCIQAKILVQEGIDSVYGNILFI